MKTLILTIVIALTATVASGQEKKDTFYLESFPTYDEYGNYYQVAKAYDHIPTSKDTADFAIESRAHISEMIKTTASQYKITLPAKKTIYKHDKVKRYTKRGSK